MSENTDEIASMAARIKEFSDWLDNEFGAGCAEDEYTEGCMSCDAGMALKHLGRLRKVLSPSNTTQVRRDE